MSAIIIPGEPRGKQRPRVVRANGVSHSYTPEQTASYENLVRLEYHRQCGGEFIPDGPVRVYIDAHFAIPRSTSRRKAAAMLAGAIRPTRKPDCDNIAKIICDALNGIAYRDDAQITELQVSKRYAPDAPYVYVIIKSLQGA